MKECPICGEESSFNDYECENCFYDFENINLSNHGSYDYEIKNIESNIDFKDEKTVNIDTKETQYSKVFPIRRFLLLMIFTLGIFEIYWFYKNSKLTFEELENSKSPLLRTILFLIPIVNIFVYYYFLKDVKSLLKTNNLESFSTGWNLLYFFFFPILHIWTLVNVQESLNEYWRLKEPKLPTLRSLKSSEKVVMIILPLLALLFSLLSILFIVAIIFSY
ncbi:hypothetical protein [Methanobrevibacter sp. DSM 116169]|uniref:hypothetical protein n=1 Tax=Methanobrevibacter sp. DSM 116169 TaxID=3242727 RepID=UPI0038FD16F7